MRTTYWSTLRWNVDAYRCDISDHPLSSSQSPSTGCLCLQMHSAYSPKIFVTIMLRAYKFYLRVVDLGKELFLIHYGVDRSFANNAGFRHFFQSEEFTLLSLLHTPYFSESTPPNNELEVEVILVDSWNVNLIEKSLFYLGRILFPLLPWNCNCPLYV